jgi:hypothetical protein
MVSVLERWWLVIIAVRARLWRRRDGSQTMEQCGQRL